MPATEEELQRIVAIAWLTVIMLTIACYTRRPLPALSPDEPDPHLALHTRNSKLEARVDKLESEMLELQGRVTLLEESHLQMIASSVMSPHGECAHAALLRRTIALEEQAKQLEASLPSSA